MSLRKKDSPDENADAKASEWLVPDDRSKVEAWRMSVLIRAGYPIAIAERLAMSMIVDLHVACDILARGCPAERAAEILL